MAAPKVEIVKAGAEGPSFGRDVAAVIAKSCTGCHGTNNPRANFSLANFERLLRGGDSGPPIVPGKPADSLLIKKLKGQAGAQMPLNLPALPADTIAAIEAWIAAGAKFDGPSTTAPVERVAAFVKAATSTHEELSEERQQIAATNWKLALPGIDSNSVSSENFHLVGNVDEATLDELGKTAEAIAPQIAEILGAPADEPLIKGRLTLFAFPQRYDYSEFGQMVEKRKLPPQWYGHWNYDGIDAYGALVPSRSEQYSSEALIAQQLAGVYVASRGTPRWFAEGAARVVTSRVAKDDPRVKAWDESLPSAFAAMRAADDFLTGKLGEEQTNLASYSFLKYLMKDTRRFRQLLTTLEDGSDFEQAFAKVYSGPPASLTPAWARSASRR
jgi:mono/diheme cytochrome c family protein